MTARSDEVPRDLPEPTELPPPSGGSPDTDAHAGRTFELDVTIDQALVDAYADLLEDHNPLHSDVAYAARTRFERPIAHGGILFGIVSRVLGMDLPGPGTVYLSQTLNFLSPVYIGERLRFRVTETNVLPKSVAVLRVEITRGDRTVVADGESRVKLPGWCLKRSEKRQT